MLLVIYHLRRYFQGITPSESVKVRHPLSLNLTITRKRCKIVGIKLVLITNRKLSIGTKIGDLE